MIFQDHHLLLDRTVYDNVAMPLIIAGASSEDIRRRVSAALDKVGLLDKAKNFPIQLSGGEQQRVGIARAVVNKPAVLLADEPTGNLDDALSEGILRLFEEFNRVGGYRLDGHPRYVVDCPAALPDPDVESGADVRSTPWRIMREKQKPRR